MPYASTERMGVAGARLSPAQPNGGYVGQARGGEQQASLEGGRMGVPAAGDVEGADVGGVAAGGGSTAGGGGPYGVAGGAPSGSERRELPRASVWSTGGV
mmetsp:Transcript_14008/g.41682  ORF Transcript_14008/g.41682 Transcript_14008/m.41682 type:complete len:100 (-) Transcript_14008:29-328(-)